MGTKIVTVCDKCGQADDAAHPVKRIVLQEDNADWCLPCTIMAVKLIYGPVPEDAPQNDVNTIRLQQLQESSETPVYIVSPAEAVVSGQKVVYGKGKKQIEVIEPLIGSDGRWFAKLVV